MSSRPQSREDVKNQRLCACTSSRRPDRFGLCLRIYDFTRRASLQEVQGKMRNTLKVLRKIIGNPGLPEMLLLALLIGIVGGFAAVAFHYLIGFAKSTFYAPTTAETFMDVVYSLPWHRRILAPAMGGLIIGPLIHYAVQEARGHGVPEVMESVVLNEGRIRLRVAPLKAVVSAICIGSGGAAGREGPVVQIGASFGSSVGQLLELGPEQIKTLLCAGVAAGIGGTFNAPLAGMVFGVEVFIRKIQMKMLVPIMFASVTGAQLANTILRRDSAILDTPHHVVTNWRGLVPYVGLGLVAAATALIYQNALYSAEHLFEKVPIPVQVKPAIGGLLLGVLALWTPQIMATGYPVMVDALNSRLSLQTVSVFMFAKILATCLTLGTGGSGGIFAPSLFIGSMMGSTYGKILYSAMPALASNPGSYATVGMGAVFAGVSHAPVSSVLLLFEMTRDPLIVLPLTLACAVSSAATRSYQRRNIYTAKLLNRGVDAEAILEGMLEPDEVVAGIPAGEANADLVAVSEKGETRHSK